MPIIDKSGVLGSVFSGVRSGLLSEAPSGASRALLTLELGCGSRKRHPDAVGIDALDYPGVDLVGDVHEILRALPAASVAKVHAYHFFEHVPDLAMLMDELARVMVQGAVLDIEVPHFANPYFYSDPTHAKFFGLYTFSYLADDKVFTRKVPNYQRAPQFELVDAELQFDSPFPVRGLIKHAIGPLFNLTRWLQEFHEENLCYMLPCYQLRFELKRR